jgi:hypothetical protein
MSLIFASFKPSLRAKRQTWLNKFLPPRLWSSLGSVMVQSWLLWSSVILVNSANAVAQGGPATFQIDNGVTGPGRYEVIVASGGGTAYGAVFPYDTGASAFDLVTEFTPFVQLGATGGARELSLYGNNTVNYIAQTGVVRSTGVIPGPNGSINWISESRLAPGSLRFENTISFSSTAAFGAVRFISYLNASVVDRMALQNTFSAPNFSLLYFNSDVTTSPTGISHGIAQTLLANASYSGWVSREATALYGNITNPTREVFSIAGVLDSLLLTTTDPRFPNSTVYRIFQSSNEPSSAYAVDLSPSATQATVVTYLTAWPKAQEDPVFRNGFEN